MEKHDRIVAQRQTATAVWSTPTPQPTSPTLAPTVPSTFTNEELRNTASVTVAIYMEQQLRKAEPAYEWACSHKYLDYPIVTLAGITFDDAEVLFYCEGTGPEGIAAMLRVEAEGSRTVINRFRGGSRDEGDLGVECVTRTSREPVCAPVEFATRKALIDWYNQLREQFWAL